MVQLLGDQAQRRDEPVELPASKQTVPRVGWRGFCFPARQHSCARDCAPESLGFSPVSVSAPAAASTDGPSYSVRMRDLRADYRLGDDVWRVYRTRSGLMLAPQT